MFIDEDFMLTTKTGRQLYHEVAKNLPIIDYHCHLDPVLIANNHRFTSITDLWLGGDHYKWRAMRANGIPEALITGDGDDWEKFNAWAATVENLVGNPLYHWTHLELKEYFGVTDLLNQETAWEIYETCNQVLAENEYTSKMLIQRAAVRYIGTTDDVLSDLKEHRQLKGKNSFVVAPTFRPDPLLHIQKGLAAYVAQCQVVSGKRLATYADLVAFLTERVAYFHEVGCRISDHGLNEFLYQEATDEEIETIYQKGLHNQTITRLELGQWQGRLMRDLGRQYAKRGWTMQIHFGAVRSANSRLFNKLGADIGCDSILDQGDTAMHLNAFLDALDQTEELPKTILYNLNPMINDLVATACGNFQSNSQGIKNKVQFGAGWWFNDTFDGMTKQLDTLANQGLLMNFVGMLTDSRSFISYPRHDYFRRILCDYLGKKVESGFYPNDQKLLEKMVRGICYENARTYFDLQD